MEPSNPTGCIEHPADVHRPGTAQEEGFQR